MNYQHFKKLKRIKTSKLKHYGTNTNVSLNPEQYPVDLSKTYDQKLASIAEIREEVRLKSEQLAKKRKVREHYETITTKIIETLRPTNHRSKEEIRKTVDFLKRIL